MPMRHQAYIGRSWMLGVLLILGASFKVAAQSNLVATTKPPVGVYVSASEVSPSIYMKFNTNGEYQVQIAPCGPLGCLSQKGKWKWDEQKREFLLSPVAPAELWHFDFRRFRTNSKEPGTLHWIRPDEKGNVLGVYRSVTFTRREE